MKKYVTLAQHLPPPIVGVCIGFNIFPYLYLYFYLYPYPCCRNYSTMTIDSNRPNLLCLSPCYLFFGHTNRHPSCYRNSYPSHLSCQRSCLKGMLHNRHPKNLLHPCHFYHFCHRLLNPCHRACLPSWPHLSPCFCFCPCLCPSWNSHHFRSSP